MKHSVVIGGAGFVGSWVVDEILKDPSTRVTIVDNLISSEKWNISIDPRVTFIEGSAADMDVLKLIEGKADYIYLLSCFHGNENSISRIQDDFENGLRATLISLEWIRQNQSNAKVIYSGTGCAVAEKTWDEPKPVPELNYINLQHDSPYAITKIAGEMYCLYYIKQFNLNIIRLRFQNVYGPKEVLGAGIWRGTKSTIWRNVIPTLIYKAIYNLDIEIFGNGDASRDFIYAEDLARGVKLASDRGKSGEIYNLASGYETNILDLAKTIIQLTNSKSHIKLTPVREWDSSGRRVGDTSKTNLELRFKSNTSIKKGLQKTIDWTIKNISTINMTMNKHKL